jgi:hypothetical protein
MISDVQFVAEQRRPALPRDINADKDDHGEKFPKKPLPPGARRAARGITSAISGSHWEQPMIRVELANRKMVTCSVVEQFYTWNIAVAVARTASGESFDRV